MRVVVPSVENPLSHPQHYGPRYNPQQDHLLPYGKIDRRLLVNYQWRDRTRVLQLTRRTEHTQNTSNDHAAAAATTTSRRVSMILQAHKSHHTGGGGGGSSGSSRSVPEDLVVSQARLNTHDMLTIVQHLKARLSRCRQQQTVTTTTTAKTPVGMNLCFSGCLLESLSVLECLWDFLRADDDEHVRRSCGPASNNNQKRQWCTIGSIQLVATEVLQEDNRHELESCILRPLLRQARTTTTTTTDVSSTTVVEGNNEPLPLTHLQLCNVDLEGRQDGELLAQWLLHNPQIHTLDMYQSQLGRYGAEGLYPALLRRRRRSPPNENHTADETISCAAGPSFAQEEGGGLRALWLGYTSLEDSPRGRGLGRLVRVLQHPDCTLQTLGFYRNHRTATHVVRNLLVDVLEQSRSLRHLFLSECPQLWESSTSRRRAASLHEEFSTTTSNDGTTTTTTTERLIEALARNQTLHSLSVSPSCGMDAPSLAATLRALARQANLRALKVHTLKMTDPAMTQFLQCLPLMPQLQSLQLTSTTTDFLDPSNWVVLWQLLQNHTRLTYLDGDGWMLLQRDDPHVSQIMQRNWYLQNVWKTLRRRSSPTPSNASSQHTKDDENQQDTKMAAAVLPHGLWPLALARLAAHPWRLSALHVLVVHLIQEEQSLVAV